MSSDHAQRRPGRSLKTACVPPFSVLMACTALRKKACRSFSGLMWSNGNLCMMTRTRRSPSFPTRCPSQEELDGVREALLSIQLLFEIPQRACAPVPEDYEELPGRPDASAEVYGDEWSDVPWAYLPLQELPREVRHRLALMWAVEESWLHVRVALPQVLWFAQLHEVLPVPRGGLALCGVQLLRIRKYGTS